jgi:uncharacterized protein with GYD domain
MVAPRGVRGAVVHLLEASYTQSGVQGLIKEGGSSRRDTIAKMLADVGGTLDAFYFAFGDDDVVIIADIPDQETAAAISLSVGAAGAATVKTTVLMEPEQVDGATKRTIQCRPPGA